MQYACLELAGAEISYSTGKDTFRSCHMLCMVMQIKLETVIVSTYSLCRSALLQ